MEKIYMVDNIWIAQLDIQYTLKRYSDIKMCHVIPPRKYLLLYNTVEYQGQIMTTLQNLFAIDEDTVKELTKYQPWVSMATENIYIRNAVSLKDSPFLTEEEYRSNHITQERLLQIETILACYSECKEEKPKVLSYLPLS